jgi:SMC interacting uncharacterized protein involved in chromosome segregation
MKIKQNILNHMKELSTEINLINQEIKKLRAKRDSLKRKIKLMLTIKSNLNETE